MLHSNGLVIEFARFVASTLAPIRYNLIRQTRGLSAPSQCAKKKQQWENFHFLLLESYAFINVSESYNFKLSFIDS